MDLFSNTYLIQNTTQIVSAFLIAFLIAFLLTPFVGKLAHWLKAEDLPAFMRRKKERGVDTRMHTTIIPRWGGLAMTCAILLTLILTNNLNYIPNGALLGFLIIAIVGIMDDKFDNLGGGVLLLGQCIAAAVVVISGISITAINVLGVHLDFNWFSAVVEFRAFAYNFIFPADFLTILWIVGLINVINWVGGVDGLNGGVSSVILATMLLFIISRGDVTLATIIAIHIGAIQGVFPYNYNPAKIYYGSSGDYVNGYLLAIFAILGGARWTVTFIVLALPIIDALIVVFLRLREHPLARRNPLRLLSISDRNHLHHRLLRAGYSRKTVMLAEVAITTAICGIAIIFSDLEKQYIAFFSGFSLLFVMFSAVFFLMKRNEKNRELLRLYLAQRRGKPDDPRSREAVVKVIIKDKKEKDDYERFVY